MRRKQQEQYTPSSAKPKTWGKFSQTNTRRSEPFTKAISIQSNSASAQYNLRSTRSIARPFGQTRDELMTTVRSVPSSAALSIFASTPQSVQYIRLQSTHTPFQPTLPAPAFTTSKTLVPPVPVVLTISK